MRIFYAADHEIIPGSKFWHNNLFLSLVDLGHEVVQFDYDLTFHFLNADPSIPSHQQFIDKFKPKLEQNLIAQIKAEHKKKPIDLLFSYFYNSFCSADTIHEIRHLGICTLNWYCNGSYQFHLVNKIAPAYDYCLVPEKFRLQDYLAVGANPIYFQEAANPNIYKPYVLDKEYDVTFVGQKYGNRPEYIRSIMDAGLDVRVWGQGWQQESMWEERIHKFKKLAKQYGIKAAFRKSYETIRIKSFDQIAVAIPSSIIGPPLSDEELIKMYSRSKISLGFSVVDTQETALEPIKQVRLRDFEAPMSGAFYMTEYMEELEQFFDIGSEMVCYSSKEDLIEKIQYYLRHETEREKIRLAGFKAG
jgi:spore maturation protein CgeB